MTPRRFSRRRPYPGRRGRRRRWAAVGGAMRHGGEAPPAKRPKAAVRPPRPAEPHGSAAPRRQPPPAGSQRRGLPIFQAREPLLSQLRGLDSAVLIGEGRAGAGRGWAAGFLSATARPGASGAPPRPGEPRRGRPLKRGSAPGRRAAGNGAAWGKERFGRKRGELSCCRA